MNSTICSRNICPGKNKKNKALPLMVVSLVALLGLQGCSSGGGGSTPAPSTPTLTVAAASVVEGPLGITSTLDFTVSLSPAASSDVTVAYSTSDNTATATNPNADYIASSGATLVIPAGQTSGTISITVNGDVDLEFDETFDLQVSNAQNATISGGSQTVTGTILSDDSLAGYYTGDSSIKEVAGNAAVVRMGNIKVIADINRLSIIDLANGFIYIANISSLTFDSNASQYNFSANARIYKDGDYTGDNANITGVVNQDANQTITSLDLSFTADSGNAGGNGDYTVGTMALAYSTKNSDTPLVFDVLTGWRDILAGGGFTVNTSTSINISTNINTNNVKSAELGDCRANPVMLDNVIAKKKGRIRKFSVSTVTICSATTPLEGYITSYNAPGTDDTVLFIWFNDLGVYAAAMQ